MPLLGLLQTGAKTPLGTTWMLMPALLIVVLLGVAYLLLVALRRGLGRGTEPRGRNSSREVPDRQSGRVHDGFHAGRDSKTPRARKGTGGVATARSRTRRANRKTE